jgi:hypothetical protein
MEENRQKIREEIRSIIVKLRDCLNKLGKFESPEGTIKRIARKTNGKEKEAYNLIGNESTLLNLALIAMNISQTNEEHYHFDEFSGFLDDESPELIISKKPEQIDAKIQTY